MKIRLFSIVLVLLRRFPLQTPLRLLLRIPLFKLLWNLKQKAFQKMRRVLLHPFSLIPHNLNGFNVRLIPLLQMRLNSFSLPPWKILVLCKLLRNLSLQNLLSEKPICLYNSNPFRPLLPLKSRQKERLQTL